MYFQIQLSHQNFQIIQDFQGHLDNLKVLQSKNLLSSQDLNILTLVQTPLRNRSEEFFNTLLIEEIQTDLYLFRSMDSPTSILLQQESPHFQKMQPSQKTSNTPRISDSTDNISYQYQKSENNIGIDNVHMNQILSCTCKKSSCIKNYCECFKAGLGCSNNCRCFQCKNKKIEAVLAQKKKLLEHTYVSCNCKKSECMKNYCECFNAKKQCSQYCNCISCKNEKRSNESYNSKKTVIESMKLEKSLVKIRN